MMQAQDTDRDRRTAPRMLSKQDIDRRIASALAEVFEDDRRDAAQSLAPRWISAAEIVRRVRPLLSRN